jgi:hypothetical protein
MIGVLVFTDDQQKVYDVTDFDGKVVLKNMKYNYVINFHYIGYEDLRLEFFEIRNTGGIVRMQVQAITTQEKRYCLNQFPNGSGCFARPRWCVYPKKSDGWW